MSGPGAQDNDVRGWTLDHDQFRGVLADLTDQVRALRSADTAAASALARWWRSTSASLVHHFRAEEQGIWPTLVRAAPEASAALARLTEQHRAIEAQLRDLDGRFAALPAAASSKATAERLALLEALARLRTSLLDHLDAEEREAVPVLRSRVPAADCRSIERAMVQGLSLREVADLLPRILAFADAADQAAMLARLPPPVRLLNRWVFTPRYHRIRSALPAGRIAPGAAEEPG